MQVDLYSLDLGSPRLLSIMGRPRGGDWLVDEMAAARRAGVDILVSALTPSEERELGLVNEREAALLAGLQFISIPIPDVGVPSLDESTMETLRQLAAVVTGGRHVAVHCRMGMGRSSMIAATILGLSGHDTAIAFDIIEQARGLQVPDTEEQRAWVAGAIEELRAT